MYPVTILFSLLAFTSLHLFAAEKKEEPDFTGNALPSKRISFRHIESKGVGYNQGYTSLDLFMATNEPIHSLVPFIDTRLHVFNDRRPAANLGLGLRTLSSSWVYGINAYYDYRKTHHFHYNQVSLGLEALGKKWDVRLNGYLPVGKKKSTFFDTKFSNFEGNYANLTSKQEFSMKGLNAEAGYHFKKMKHASFYAAAGPYYFYNEGKNAIGGEARASTTVFDHFKFEVSGSYDPVFHGIVQGQVSGILLLGPKSSSVKKGNQSSSKPYTVNERVFQSVDRSEIIVVDHVRKTTKAIDPDTGKPYVFYFVDNTSHSAGTFESPYPTLAQAEAASGPKDILYVFPGSANYDVGDGLHLQNYQKLWGSGTNQQLSTTRGLITISSQTDSMPTLTGGIADFGVVNLANNNEVSGIHITGSSPAGYGVLGGDGASVIYTVPSFGIENVNLKNNLLDGSYERSAVRLVARGKSMFEKNTLEATIGAEYVGLEIITKGSDDLLSTVLSSDITVYGANASSAMGIFPYESGSLVSTILSSSLSANIDGPDYAVGILGYTGFNSEGSSMLTSNIIDSKISASISRGESYGIYMETDLAGDLVSNITDSEIVATASEGGVYCVTIWGYRGNSVVSNITSSSISGIAGGDDSVILGVYYVTEGLDDVVSNITSSEISVRSTGGSYGLYLQNTGNGTMTSSVSLSDLEAQGGSAEAVSIGIHADSGVLTSTISSSNLSAVQSNTYSKGLEITSLGGSHLVSTLEDCYISSASSGNNGSYGVDAHSQDTSVMYLDILSNNFTVVGNGGAGTVSYGVLARESIGSSLTGLIKGNEGAVSGTATTKEAIQAPTVTQSNNTITVE